MNESVGGQTATEVDGVFQGIQQPGTAREQDETGHDRHGQAIELGDQSLKPGQLRRDPA